MPHLMKMRLRDRAYENRFIFHSGPGSFVWSSSRGRELSHNQTMTMESQPCLSSCMIQMGNLPRYHFVHYPEDGPYRTLSQYAITQVLTEAIRIPGHRSVARRAMLHLKLVLRRSFRALLAAHRAGFCLDGDFSGNNFAVDDRLFVKLVNVRLINFLKALGEKDYSKFIHVQLHEVFAREPVPTEVDRWLHLISKGIQGYEYVISYHNSMMEYHQGITSHMSLYMIFEGLKNKNPSLYRLIISWMPQYNGWKSRRAYCFNDLLNRTRHRVEPKTGKLVDYPDDIRGVLKLIRNCWQHKAKFYEDLLAMIIGVDFPCVLADFQECMFDAAQLGQLNLEYTME